LLLLTPLVGEYLLGNVSIVEIAALPILALVYGSGAVLIREVARRAGRGWPTILALGLAHGLIEAGLIDQTLFNAPQLTGDAVGAAARAVPFLTWDAASIWPMIRPAVAGMGPTRPLLRGAEAVSDDVVRRDHR
jgi:hypothetical protein